MLGQRRRRWTKINPKSRICWGGASYQSDQSPLTHACMYTSSSDRLRHGQILTKIIVIVQAFLSSLIQYYKEVTILP